MLTNVNFFLKSTFIHATKKREKDFFFFPTYVQIKKKILTAASSSLGSVIAVETFLVTLHENRWADGGNVHVTSLLIAMEKSSAVQEIY